MGKNCASLLRSNFGYYIHFAVHCKGSVQSGAEWLKVGPSHGGDFAIDFNLILK